jgi:PiT family inorganic phosphate transporter
MPWCLSSSARTSARIMGKLRSIGSGSSAPRSVVRYRRYARADEPSAVTPTSIAAFGVVVAFAFMLGASDAANASAVLIASRAASYRQAMAFSFLMTAVGGMLAGEAVAVTMTTLVRVAPNQLPGTYLAGGITSLAFAVLQTRRGVPVSASIALVGGLSGAAATEAGWGAVGWGGFHGVHPYGVLGSLLAIVVSPVLGGCAAAGFRRWLGRLLPRATREVAGLLRTSIWVSAGLVGLADGSNDGQKAMGITIHNFAVPFYVIAVVALVLAAGTAAGGRKVVRTVSSRFYRGGLLDGLAAQSASAVVILGAAVLGAPVSTSTVVASGMIGVGTARRRRHVHWPTVRTVVSAWVITVPTCALLAAAVVELGRLPGALA